MHNPFRTRLLIGAFLTSFIGIGLSACSEPPRETIPGQVEIVVRYKFNENTGDFDVSFEDGMGNPAEQIKLDDPSNPLGELANRTETNQLNILDGTTSVTFFSKNSPGCAYTCVGKYCGVVCS